MPQSSHRPCAEAPGALSSLPTSAAGPPPSTCCSTAVICSTEKRFFFTAASWPDGPDYAAVLTSPMCRSPRSPVFAADVGGWAAALDLLQHGGDLLDGKALLLHGSLLARRAGLCRSPHIAHVPKPPEPCLRCRRRRLGRRPRLAAARR